MPSLEKFAKLMIIIVDMLLIYGNYRQLNEFLNSQARESSLVTQLSLLDRLHAISKN